MFPLAGFCHRWGGKHTVSVKAFINIEPTATMKTTCILSRSALAAMILIPTIARGNNQILNGSFEGNFGAWEAGGNVSLQSSSPYGPTDGQWLAAFNASNSTPNGYLTTAVATVPGKRYRLEFDVGNLSYNSLHQRLHVIVEDNAPVPPPPGARGPYIDDMIDIAGPGRGATAWVAASYDLIPQQGYVRLSFRDVSPSTISLDLVLDHVRLTPIENLLTNGSFENDLEGWDAGGNLLVQSQPPYQPVDGGKLLAFNAGNSSPNGTIEQFIPLQEGRRYRLEFQVGNLAFNSLKQRLQVTLWTLWGYKQLTQVADTIEIPGPGGGATAWMAASYDFTASGSYGSLSFTDVSPATNSLDLVLDNVRITEIRSGNLITNGGFEDDMTGWDSYSLSNITVQSDLPYVPTEGSKLLSFNDQNRAPAASISQTLPVVPGQRYKLEFDAGNLAYKRTSQRMRVMVAEYVNSVFLPPLERTFDLLPPSTSGTTRWERKTFYFTPQSDTITLVFNDLSTSTLAVDMVLDKVSLTLEPED